MKNKINKVIVIAFFIFLFFFIKSMNNIFFTKIDLGYRGKSENLTPSEAKKEILPSFLDFSLFEKVKAGNIFLSALSKSPSITSQLPTSSSETGLPPLGKNEIRDKETGFIFKFLGTLTKGEERLAIFLKVGNLGQDEKRCVFLPKGGKLSKNIKIIDIGKKGIKVNSGGENIELWIFELEIIQLDVKKS